MAQMPVTRIQIEGFKSIRKLDLELRDLNVLIGANGAGKSNFVEFFVLLRDIVHGQLRVHVAERGGAGLLLFGGVPAAREILADVAFRKTDAGLQNGYRFRLEATDTGGLWFREETVWFQGPGHGKPYREELGQGHVESNIDSARTRPGRSGAGPSIAAYVHESISSWVTYHFHDSSRRAPMRQAGSRIDSAYLRADASNLAAFLLRMREGFPVTYRLILDTVRSVAPFLRDFQLAVRPTDVGEQVLLSWYQHGSDEPFHPLQLSDGTIRFIALAAALLQPEPPKVILIDEPELGQHPQSLDLVAALLRKAASTSQVIVATQSSALLDHVSPEDVIVAERGAGETRLRRLESEALKSWLEDYGLGELWRKNVFGGGAVHE